MYPEYWIPAFAGYDGSKLSDAVPRDGARRRTTELFDNLSEKLVHSRSADATRFADRSRRRCRDARGARALLEADVSLDVVRSFTEKVREQRSAPRGQVGDPRPDGGEDRSRRTGSPRSAPMPDHRPQRRAAVAVMMVGLQGSGKTTTTAKLGRR